MNGEKKIAYVTLDACIILYRYTLIRCFWGIFFFFAMIGLLVSLETKMSTVLVMDTELSIRTRVTCLCFGFEMLITVTWCKATQVTLERIAFLLHLIKNPLRLGPF